jgi:hypothetical protein
MVITKKRPCVGRSNKKLCIRRILKSDLLTHKRNNLLALFDGGKSKDVLARCTGKGTVAKGKLATVRKLVVHHKPTKCTEIGK